MFHLDALALASLAILGLISLVTLALHPRLRRATDERAAFLLVVGGTALAYLAASPWLFLVGWTLSVAPFWWGDDADPIGPSVLLLFSTLALTVAFVLDARGGGDRLHLIAFVLVTIAAVTRQGVFPSHVWVPRAAERGSLPILNVFLNGHLGVYALVRFGIGVLHGTPGPFDWLEGLGLVSAVYTALLAVVATRPRRTLSLLIASHSAFILTGIVSGNLEGSTGAFVHWWGLSLATTLLVGVYCALEARTTDVDTPRRFLGLGVHAPRLAVFFAAGALAIAGLPGTIGFVAEDLLFHGAMEAHPVWGVALPLAATVNAITAFVLFSTLFLGRRGAQVPVVPDARPFERWVLTVPLVLLVGGGLVPHVLVAMRTPTASWLVSLLAPR